MNTPVAPDWQKRGVCGVDPDKDRWVDLPALRVRGRNNPAYTDHVNSLRQVCQGCPVATDCRNDALHHDYIGVWGGTDEFDRADMRDAAGLTTHVDNSQRAQVRRLAHAGYTNTAISQMLGSSAMAISRIFDERDQEDRI